MSRLVFHRDDEVAALVGKMVRAPIVPPFTAIGIEKEHCLVGGVVFNAFTGPDIELTIAGRLCWTRGIFRALAHYVFHQLQCVRCSITIRSTDRDTLDLARRLGFSVEGIHQLAFWDADGVSLGLLRSNCRFLKGR
jgi:RimJ/RimL family protein N-acetyltransferase